MTTEFQERVYKLLREIPRGKVTTYGDLARVLDSAPRAVGQACRNNPYAPETPCHRVVSMSGGIGGFAGQTRGSEIRKKISLLRSEGVEIGGGSILRFAERRHTF